MCACVCVQGRAGWGGVRGRNSGWGEGQEGTRTGPFPTAYLCGTPSLTCQLFKAQLKPCILCDSFFGHPRTRFSLPWSLKVWLLIPNLHCIHPRGPCLHISHIYPYTFGAEQLGFTPSPDSLQNGERKPVLVKSWHISGEACFETSLESGC